MRAIRIAAGVAVKDILAVTLVLLFSSAHGGTLLSLTHLAGPIYISEDSHYRKENSVVYIGVKSVTVIGATFTSETAKLLADEIRKTTSYLGPSHTPDGVFVYFPEEQVLYGGCILKEQIGNLAYADLIEYPKILNKLKQLNLDIRTIVAGHASAVHGPELIDQYLALLNENAQH